jgi:purine-binding chemotaxis protein CheW
MENSVDSNLQHYISFSLAGEYFAINVLRVVQVLEATSFTPVPQAPRFLKGVTNFNGKIIPVVNLHEKFGFQEPEDKSHQLIIILNVEYQGAEVEIGILVDDSDEVYAMDPGLVKPYPVSGDQEKAAFIEGVISRKERFAFLLKVNNLFDDNEIKNIISEKQ